MKTPKKHTMRLFPRRRRGGRNLLPADAYPRDPTTGTPMPGEKRAVVDRKIRELLAQHPLPTEPGEYVDGIGDRWVLDARGGWTDCRGIRRDARYAPILVLFIDADGPFVRVGDR